MHDDEQDDNYDEDHLPVGAPSGGLLPQLENIRQYIAQALDTIKLLDAGMPIAKGFAKINTPTSLTTTITYSDDAVTIAFTAPYPTLDILSLTGRPITKIVAGHAKLHIEIKGFPDIELGVKS